jgi:short subunit dehydrogenase-like uncharacterized protein
MEMGMPTWMLYGATGYTGVLLAEEAVRRGHRPLLAGRSADKLNLLAERLGLDYLAVGLDDSGALAQAVSGVGLVLHAAGPFSQTSDPMIRACLAAGAHYLDLTGEIPVFENTFSYHEAALEKGVALMSGAGFDVIPTDCLASYVADKVPDANTLDIAFDAITRASGGTTRTQLEIMARGGLARRDGQLVRYPLGSGARRIRFTHGEKFALPAPLADLATVYRATGIPNITAYVVLPRPLARLAGLAAPFFPAVQALLGSARLRRGLGWLIERIVYGPEADFRRTARSYLWARAANARGDEAQAWLETVEAYQFTAIAAIRCVERVLDGNYRGALTPAQAFGADFVLEIEGTKRVNAWPTWNPPA